MSGLAKGTGNNTTATVTKSAQLTVEVPKPPQFLRILNTESRCLAPVNKELPLDALTREEASNVAQAIAARFMRAYDEACDVAAKSAEEMPALTPGSALTYGADGT